ncbi:helix-turn-helix domain-containing protein [Marixanthomonas ophiurae]|uniref:Helix-turn-helix domain-containing protein n=1 Tax=Marixanthomonas ophiurae TaxID=387659 RepID=A0A3E1Q6B1_9FLAO|nr:helix-turn-helix domain-containing protein [Marixanthomonas ophiurae]RFN57673.1 helix-turn-helix domain-containing protein [Marixanthomonas ophiurae]
MAKLTQYREQQNLTQEELAEKAGVSVRTIQRIEAGATPKGYTLKTLASVLRIPESSLREDTPAENFPTPHMVKIINLSSLSFLILPFGNIIVPLVIMYLKKEVNTLTKQLVSIQILWTVVVCLLMIASPFLIDWLSLPKQAIIFILLGAMVVNLIIILLNAREIHSRNKLYCKLPFSFL